VSGLFAYILCAVQVCGFTRKNPCTVTDDTCGKQVARPSPKTVPGTLPQSMPNI
jgi:hypothetical protein